MNLEQSSIDYMTNTPIEHRKKLGQYMTPTTVSDILFDQLELKSGDKVLDPAVGTGELLIASKRRSNGLDLYGWDVDPQVLKIASKAIPEAHMGVQSVHDSIPEQYKEYFDYIIGNPPYFELKKDEYDPSHFTAAGGGRTNIYALFFEKYLPLLKPNGIMAYIIPPSMNAGAYFANLRKYITEHATIKHLEIVRTNSHFQNALTSVQIIVLQKTLDTNVNKNKFVVNFNQYNKTKNLPTIFTDNKKVITKAWANKQSLYDYGYEVVTGTIAWNEHKTSLSDTPTASNTILYYAKDIKNTNIINLSPTVSDRRYIQTTKPPLTGETILVNRIVGSLDNPQLKIAKVDEPKYFAENHVNVIKARTDITPTITLDELYIRLTKFENLSTYLQALTGNTQLSAKELMFLIPV